MVPHRPGFGVRRLPAFTRAINCVQDKIDLLAHVPLAAYLRSSSARGQTSPYSGFDSFVDYRLPGA